MTQTLFSSNFYLVHYFKCYISHMGKACLPLFLPLYRAYSALIPFLQIENWTIFGWVAADFVFHSNATTQTIAFPAQRFYWRLYIIHTFKNYTDMFNFLLHAEAPPPPTAKQWPSSPFAHDFGFVSMFLEHFWEKNFRISNPSHYLLWRITWLNILCTQKRSKIHPFQYNGCYS